MMASAKGTRKRSQWSRDRERGEPDGGARGCRSPACATMKGCAKAATRPITALPAQSTDRAMAGATMRRRRMKYSDRSQSTMAPSDRRLHGPRDDRRRRGRRSATRPSRSPRARSRPIQPVARMARPVTMKISLKPLNSSNGSSPSLRSARAPRRPSWSASRPGGLRLGQDARRPPPRAGRRGRCAGEGGDRGASVTAATPP